MKGTTMNRKILYFLPVLLILFVWQSCENPDASIFGKWKLNSKKSTDLVTWRYRQLEMTIRDSGDKIEIINHWKSRRAGDWIDSVAVVPGGDTTRVLVKSPIWPENWYMGVLSLPNTEKKISGYWNKPNKDLTTFTKQLVQISQGEALVETERQFYVNRRGDELTLIEKRSTRPTEILMVFDRITE